MFSRAGRLGSERALIARKSHRMPLEGVRRSDGPTPGLPRRRSSGAILERSSPTLAVRRGVAVRAGLGWTCEAGRIGARRADWRACLG